MVSAPFLMPGLKDVSKTIDRMELVVLYFSLAAKTASAGDYCRVV